jgi:chromosome segregation ATPase
VFVEVVREDEMTLALEGVKRNGLEGLRSPARVLAGWFRESRDNWKQKYVQAKKELKRYKVRASDIDSSRQRWKDKYETSQRELETLQAELEQLRNQIAARVPDDEPSDNSAESVEKKGGPLATRGN